MYLKTLSAYTSCRCFSVSSQCFQLKLSQLPGPTEVRLRQHLCSATAGACRLHLPGPGSAPSSWGSIMTWRSDAGDIRNEQSYWWREGSQPKLLVYMENIFFQQGLNILVFFKLWLHRSVECCVLKRLFVWFRFLVVSRFWLILLFEEAYLGNCQSSLSKWANHLHWIFRVARLDYWRVMTSLRFLMFIYSVAGCQAQSSNCHF